MASKNILKIMEEQQQVSKKARVNTTEEMETITKAKKFVDTYVVPKFYKLQIDNINVRDGLIWQASQIAIMLCDITLENTPNPVYLSVNEVGFLESSDTKAKASVGNKIAEHIIRGYTYEQEKNNYIDEYIKPILKELHKENIITYDVEALDNKTKIATNRTQKLVDKFINDNAKESLNFGLFRGLYDEDYISKWDFIFSEEKQPKKDFTNTFKEYIKNNYDKIDFKNIDNIDFADITGAKLD